MKGLRIMERTKYREILAHKDIMFYLGNAEDRFATLHGAIYFRRLIVQEATG